ncbi:twin-arginine translocase TatA/TatE family subunit [Corynebacterium sp.]|uniref:twin-arginine translocase TatA/TatE family subunit n=1 Tax=Corynebacterium sp. TaxID=1720 RepID=UPI0025C3B16D|nr:twin-arginine translocase TatA/TatE family subunit [Corynebacterium sp.]
MFGLSIEKIIVVGMVAAVVIGPQRLPLYAEKLATVIRNFRSFTESTRRRAEEELGVPVAAMDPTTWNSRFRAYDPRRIVRDALDSDGTERTPERTGGGVAAAASTESGPVPGPLREYRERWVVVGGSSGHPVRRRIVEPVAPDSDVPDIADIADVADVADPVGVQEHSGDERTASVGRGADTAQWRHDPA